MKNIAGVIRACLLVTAVCAAADLADDGIPIAISHGSPTHTFHFKPPAGATTVPVSIAGDFNGWSATPNPTTRAADGSYSTTVEMDAGLHHYKVVYDGKWIADPAADKSLDQIDGFGGFNSGFFADVDAAQFEPPVPGAIDAAAVVFDPADVRDLDVISPAVTRLSLRARADDVAEATAVTGTTRTPMAVVSTEAGMNRFAATVGPGPFLFELKKPGATAFVAAGRVYTDPPAARYTPPAEPTFVTPDWARHAVWYQILPERFRNGDPTNDPPHTVKWTCKWFDPQPGEHGDYYSIINDRRYGGDLQGVRQQLPYLKRLGVTAIYLNPIFESPSLHKYNTADYRHVDEHLGVIGDTEPGETDDPATWRWTASDRVFLDLVAEAHHQGFHVIIDGVYNHVGTDFWAFQDVIKNGKSSRYAGWFDILDWNPGTDRFGHPIPFHYRAWDGDNGEAPEFKKDSVLGLVHGPREHVLAVAKRWLVGDGDPIRGVDGFRLDAPEKIPHPFWIDFRKMVKGTKPDALMSGEIWPWAQPWLGGDQFDGVTNYQFAIPAQQFFVNQKLALKPSEMAAACNRLVNDYPFQSSLVNMNLLDSHDTDRAASMFVNPDLGYGAANRIQDGHPTYSPRKPNETERQKMLQEVVFQMTFAGAPMIYYGDEAGMWGAGDPSGRQPMTWADLAPYDDPEISFDAGKFDHYQRLIAVRRTLPALQTGSYRKLMTDDAAGTFAFVRELESGRVYVVLNRSDKPATVKVPVKDAGPLINWLDPAAVDVDMTADRPVVRAHPAPTTMATDKAVEVKLPAYGSAVLAGAPR